ncbi:hypothetical protein Hanom_Chr06g00544691 [Helianthus anomalus]
MLFQCKYHLYTSMETLVPRLYNNILTVNVCMKLISYRSLNTYSYTRIISSNNKKKPWKAFQLQI